MKCVKVILVGHVAADLTASETETGMRVTFPIATHRRYISDGVKTTANDHYLVVARGKLAEICARYLSKGHGVYVEGILFNRAYRSEGKDRGMTEIYVDEVNRLTWKYSRGVETVSLDSLQVE